MDFEARFDLAPRNRRQERGSLSASFTIDARKTIDPRVLYRERRAASECPAGGDREPVAAP